MSLLLLSRFCVFDFQKFHCVLSWMSLSLSFFAFNSPSWMWKFVSFTKFVFSHYFFGCSFCPTLLSSRTPMIQTLNLLLPSNRSLRQLFQACFLSLRLNQLCGSVLRLALHSHFHLLFNPPTEDLLLYFSVLLSIEFFF